MKPDFNLYIELKRGKNGKEALLKVLKLCFNFSKIKLLNMKFSEFCRTAGKCGFHGA